MLFPYIRILFYTFLLPLDKKQRRQSGFTRPSSLHQPLFMVQDRILT